MTHLLFQQLRFARSEFARCLDGVQAVEARRRLGPMNCISWIVGHMADQEQRYWLQSAQGIEIAPQLNALVGYSRPASTPPLREMWEIWRRVTEAADVYLAELTPQNLTTFPSWKAKPAAESVGTRLLRNIHHYWFHIGEAHAIRQQLGHKALPDFVGDMRQAAYRVEGK